MKMFIFRLLWYVLLSLPDLWNSQWSGEEWHAVLPAGLLHALHPHPAPQAGGQGEVQHRGGHHGRCGNLCLLHPLCDMPDFSGDQGKGGWFLKTRKNISKIYIGYYNWSHKNTIKSNKHKVHTSCDDFILVKNNADCTMMMYFIPILFWSNFILIP